MLKRYSPKHMSDSLGFMAPNLTALSLLCTLQFSGDTGWTYKCVGVKVSIYVITSFQSYIFMSSDTKDKGISGGLLRRTIVFKKKVGRRKTCTLKLNIECISKRTDK